ncbi:MAG: HAD hydrolase family protein [Clostridia bacterium]|nr:HAD hydrolase family protein [Clostridia bacterium]
MNNTKGKIQEQVTPFKQTPIISVDIDGTLVDKKAKIRLVSKENKQSIKDFTNKGGILILNSAGTFANCKKIAKCAKIKTVISSNNGAFVSIPEQSDKPLINLRVSPETISKIKSRLAEVEPNAFVAISGKDKKYYVDRSSTMVKLFKLKEFFKFRNKLSISTSKKNYEDMMLKTYSVQIFPLPSKAGFTKETKVISKEEQVAITKKALGVLKEIMEEEIKTNGQPSFRMEMGDMGISISHPQASKLNAIKAIVEQHNQQNPSSPITSNNIYAVGDGFQDMCQVLATENPAEQFFTMSNTKASTYENGAVFEKIINKQILEKKKQKELEKLNKKETVETILDDIDEIELDENEKFSFRNNQVNSVSEAISKVTERTESQPVR